MKIDFTLEEVRAMHELLDMAVRSRGLEVAASASHIALKIDEAVKLELLRQQAEKQGE
jgi:hypothetical protein